MLKIIKENKNNILLQISKSSLLSLEFNSFIKNKIKSVEPTKEEVLIIENYKKSKSKGIKFKDFLKKYDL